MIGSFQSTSAFVFLAGLLWGVLNVANWQIFQLNCTMDDLSTNSIGIQLIHRPEDWRVDGPKSRVPTDCKDSKIKSYVFLLFGQFISIVNPSLISAYRKPAFQPSAFRRLFIGFQPSAENQPVSMEKALDLKILQVFFKNRGENFSFLKNVEFLEFFGFTLCFRTFQAKKIFQKFSDW